MFQQFKEIDKFRTDTHDTTKPIKFQFLDFQLTLRIYGMYIRNNDSMRISRYKNIM